MSTLKPLLSPNLSAISGIKHGFYTRQGGVSDGIYESLNAGSGSNDNPDNIQENRKRIAQNLSITIDKLIGVYQVHSTNVITVNAPFKGERPKADALVTNQKGLALSVLTADCGPILFADKKANIIGATHAGWRGALNGIVENTIQAMEKLGSQRSDIVAVLGPCLGPQNYEVTQEFYDNFIEQNSANNKFFSQQSDEKHFLFDLWSFILSQLHNSHIEGHALNICTYADEDRFFSYRRKTHRNEPDYGRQLSAIMLEE